MNRMTHLLFFLGFFCCLAGCSSGSADLQPTPTEAPDPETMEMPELPPTQ